MSVCPPVRPFAWNNSAATVTIFIQVKCSLVQTLRLCTGRTDHMGSRGIALLFLDHGTRRGWVVSVTSRPLFNPGKYPVPIVQEAGWAPGPVWTGAENLAPNGIRCPNRPARSSVAIPTELPGPQNKGTVHEESCTYVYDIISLSSSQNKNSFRQKL